MDKIFNCCNSFRSLIKNRFVLPIFQTRIQKRQYSKEDFPKKRVMVLESEITTDSFPDPPTNCCMSGCPSCVWLEYADKLKAHYIDGNIKAAEIIEKEVDDPSLKAYLLFELKLKTR